MTSRSKLVIHPKDRSTDFLKTVYEDLDATVVTGGVSKPELKEMVRAHDQVLMMGHGTQFGLMGVGQFKGYGNIVDDSFAELLAEKDNSVFIWCNADQYVDHNELKGFYTGMFISEVGEARCMGMPLAKQNTVTESNEWFVKAMGRAANDDPEAMHSYVKHDYGELACRNPVAHYNHKRLYVQP